MACDIPTLVTEGAIFDSVDKIDAQALRVYILALALKALQGPDYTDICALADSLRQYDGYSPAQIQSASLMGLVRIAEASGADDPGTPQSVMDAIHCAHCCGTTKNSLTNAETYLWCLLADSIPRA